MGPSLAPDFFEKFDLLKSEMDEYESLTHEPQMCELTEMQFLPKQLKRVPVLINFGGNRYHMWKRREDTYSIAVL